MALGAAQPGHSPNLGMEPSWRHFCVHRCRSREYLCAAARPSARSNPSAPSLPLQSAHAGPTEGAKIIVGAVGLPTLTPFCWKRIEHLPGMSVSYSRAPTGLQQIDRHVELLEKKTKKEVEISAPQTMLLVLRLWQLH